MFYINKVEHCAGATLVYSNDPGLVWTIDGWADVPEGSFIDCLTAMHIRVAGEYYNYATMNRM